MNQLNYVPSTSIGLRNIESTATIVLWHRLLKDAKSGGVRFLKKYEEGNPLPYFVGINSPLIIVVVADDHLPERMVESDHSTMTLYASERTILYNIDRIKKEIEACVAAFVSKQAG